MRAVILAILSFIMMNQAYATTEKVPLCSAYYFKTVKAKLLESSNDKYMHCAVSCMLARRCGAMDSFQIGVLKEIWDMFTPGDADMKDIEADLIGVQFYLNTKKISDKTCNNKCINYNWP